MNWDDIHDIIFEGSKEAVEDIRCPDCNEKIYIRYTESCDSLVYGCKRCGLLTRCYKLFYKPKFLADEQFH